MNKVNINKFGFSKLNKKGFIGAIGDDLPSLIPIIIAILIFFTVFTNTLMVYDQKNSEIRKQIELSSISRVIKTDSLILNFQQFESSCNATKLRRSNYNYMIGLYTNSKFDLRGVSSEGGVISDFVDSSQFSSNPSENFIKDLEGNSFFCGYKKIGALDFSSKTRNYLIRFYPIAMQTKIIVDGTEFFFIEPVIMAMVIWD